MVEERPPRRNVEKTCDSHRRGSAVGDHLWRNVSLGALPAVRACGSGREPPTGVQVYFLSSSIGDLLEDKEEPSRRRLAGAVAIAGALVFYFLVKRYLGEPADN